MKATVIGKAGAAGNQLSEKNKRKMVDRIGALRDGLRDIAATEDAEARARMLEFLINDDANAPAFEPKARGDALPIFYDEPPSRTMLDAAADIGSCIAECDFCGRKYAYLARSGWDWDEGEREEWAKRIEAGEVIAAQGWLSEAHIDGHAFVEDCPCNALRRYELWMLNTRYLISSFFAGHKRALEGRIITLEAEEQKLLEVSGVVVSSVNDILRLELDAEKLEARIKLREEQLRDKPLDPKSKSGSIYVQHITGYDRGDTYAARAKQLTEWGFIRLRSEKKPDKNEGGKLKYWEIWWLSCWRASGDIAGMTLEQIKSHVLQHSHAGEIEISREHWGLSFD